MRQILPVAPLLVLLLTACPANEEARPAAARVIEIRGEVTREGKPLLPGETVTLDASIVVGKGRAVLEVPDGTLIKLYDQTRLQLAGQHRVNLTLGKIWAAISKRFAGEFEVHTPNAVAGVRGTDFIVHAEASLTRVAVVTGAVEVANRKTPEKRLTVRQGKQVVVKGALPPSASVTFEPEAEKKVWDQLGDEYPEVVPLPEPVEKGAEQGSAAPDAPPTDAAAEPAAPSPPKGALEREGEATKERLKKEAAATEKRLRREEKETRDSLEKEEEKIRGDIEKDREKAETGSVKDFLD